MKTLFKLSLIIFIAIYFSACAPSGGGSAATGPGVVAPTPTPHVADNTPHEYQINFCACTNTAAVHTVSVHDVRNVGFTDYFEADLTGTYSDANGITGGFGGPTAKNISYLVTNTGTEEIYVLVSIDGVQQPQEIILPGATFTFERGF